MQAAMFALVHVAYLGFANLRRSIQQMWQNHLKEMLPHAAASRANARLVMETPFNPPNVKLVISSIWILH